MNPTTLKTRFLRALLLYALDMATAITGWVYGFGLPIKNLPVLIALCLFLRFFWHMISMALIYDDARGPLVKLAAINKSDEVHP